MKTRAASAWDIALNPPPQEPEDRDVIAVLLISDDDGEIRLLEPVADVAPETLHGALERAAHEPMAPALPGWPNEVRILASLGRDALREVVTAAGIVVAEEVALPYHPPRQRPPRQGLVDSTSPEEVLGARERHRELCKAIARLARLPRWEVFGVDNMERIEVRPPLPAPFERPLWCWLEGYAQMPGMMFLEAPAAAEELREAASLWHRHGSERPPADTVAAFEGALRGIQLRLFHEEEVPAALLEAWRARGWPRPGRTVPQLLRRRGRELAPLCSPEDHETALVLLEAAAAVYDWWDRKDDLLVEERYDELDEEEMRMETEGVAVHGGRRAFVRRFR